MIVGGTDDAVSCVLLPNEVLGLPTGVPTAVVAEAAVQLSSFLHGERHVLEVPLRSAGTAFQEEVWAAIGEIPYGKTLTYGQVAALVGRPTGPRAVGQALGANPIPLLRPCHRVVAAGGLGGYGGGLDLKHRLLAMEALNVSWR